MSDQSLTAAQARELVLASEFNWDDELQQVFDVTKFQGFDTAFTIGILRQLDPTFKFVRKSIAFIVSRGTSYDNAKKKMSDVGKQAMADIITKLKIKSGVPQSRSDITFARISACFPHWVAMAIKACNGARVLGDPNGLPTYLLFPAGASLLTSDEELKKFIKWQISFDAIVNVKAGPTPRDKLEKYVNITFNSGLFDQETRQGIRTALAN